MQRIGTVVLTAILVSSAPLGSARADEPASAEEPVVARPKVPGKLKVRLRQRVESEKGSGTFVSTSREEEWHVSETAVIICDMWDDHYCKEAARRVDEMAPRMNGVLAAARNRGVAIIHAPSGVTGVYADSPFRRRMQAAKPAQPPVPLAGWCHLDPSKEPPLPIVDSTQPCDDPVVGPRVKVFTKQHAGIRMAGYDGVSDSGPEIYNFLAQEGVKNVVLMGVHTNMCVLGRPFGIRQLVRVGFNVALCRDMTDAMYDPREPPYVSHARGTELVVEHVEAHWCPSLASEDLMKVIAGSDDPGSPIGSGSRPMAVGAAK